MTKRDFRSRRNLFKGQIRKQRDFDHFKESYDKKNKEQSSKVMLLVLLGLVIGLVLFFALL